VNVPEVFPVYLTTSFSIIIYPTDGKLAVDDPVIVGVEAFIVTDSVV